jgi:hypothetical protein
MFIAISQGWNRVTFSPLHKTVLDARLTPVRPTYFPIGEMIGLEWPRRLRYAIHENFCRYISRLV